jgi:uncharacterized membrane protein
MRKSGEQSKVPPQPPTQSTVILLLGTIADTSWRMFVPTISTILLGFWADSSWGTKPWLTILGILIGTAITALLIKRQFDEVKKTI